MSSWKGICSCEWERAIVNEQLRGTMVKVFEEQCLECCLKTIMLMMMMTLVPLSANDNVYNRIRHVTGTNSVNIMLLYYRKIIDGKN